MLSYVAIHAFSYVAMHTFQTPSHTPLCCAFSGEALVGMSIFSLLENPADGEAFCERCKSVTPEDFAEHKVSIW